MKKLLLSAFILLSTQPQLSATHPVPAQTYICHNHPLRTAQQQTTDNPSETDIYDITMLVSEDFSKFTKGSVSAPDTELLDGYISPELTATPGWSAAYAVYQAGGCVYIDRNANNDANLCSPIITIPDNGKPVVVTFKGRLGDKDYNFDYVEVYMVDYSDKTRPAVTHQNDYAKCYDEWIEYKFVFDKPRKGSEYFFQFSGYDAAAYFDDIEIKFLDPKVETPVAEGYTDFRTDSFTACWDAVDQADGYLVSLYTINNDRDKTHNYIVKDLKTDECHHTFTGIETWNNIYYYTVKATKGLQQSPESKPVKVCGLITPTDINVTPDGSDNLTISWTDVPGAEYYELEAFRSHEAKADETFVLCEENFDKLVCSGTPTEPIWDLPLQEELDQYTNQPGWIAENPAHINGAYGLTGYYYQQYGQPAYLQSPYMDLSAAGGKVSVSADLYGAYVTDLDICNAIIRMLTIDLENNEATAVNRQTITDLPAEWGSYSVDLSGGTKLSAVEICATAGYLFIDNLRITQQLKAGEKVKVIYSIAKTDDNQIKIPVFDLLRGSDLNFRIRAVREIWDEMHFSINEYVRSPYTAEQTYSVATSGIEDTTNSRFSAKAFVENGQLFIVNPECLPVDVFDISGRQVASDHNGSQLVTVTLGEKGMYIVRIADRSVKVVF